MLILIDDFVHAYEYVRVMFGNILLSGIMISKFFFCFRMPTSREKQSGGIIVNMVDQDSKLHNVSYRTIESLEQKSIFSYYFVFK